MPRFARHLLTVGLGLVAAACASSARAPRPACVVSGGPEACEARRLLGDTALYGQLARLSTELDSILTAGRAARLIPDTAGHAELMRRLADTTLHAQLRRRRLGDSAQYARLVQLTHELDSLLAGIGRERGARLRP